jgi:hypothetical protein
MNDVEPHSPGSPGSHDSPVEGLIRRALNLLLHPNETWDAIEAEPDTIERLFRYWVLPLAAIPAVCRMLERMSFGNFGSFRIFGVRFYHPSFVGIIGDAVASYALTLISVYLLALIIDHFAIQFGGERSRTQAFKVVAYSGTAAWVAGLFMLLPTAGGLFALLGMLYSLYLLYLGLPKLMRSAPAFTLNYFGLTLLAAFVMAVIIGGVSSRAGDFGGPVWID